MREHVKFLLFQPSSSTCCLRGNTITVCTVCSLIYHSDSVKDQKHNLIILTLHTSSIAEKTQTYVIIIGEHMVYNLILEVLLINKMSNRNIVQYYFRLNKSGQQNDMQHVRLDENAEGISICVCWTIFCCSCCWLHDYAQVPITSQSLPPTQTLRHRDNIRQIPFTVYCLCTETRLDKTDTSHFSVTGWTSFVCVVIDCAL